VGVCSSQKKQGKSKTAHRFQRFQESDYMDPNQGLCLGALFDIAATNVSTIFFDLISFMRFFLQHLLHIEISASRDLIWAEDFVFLGSAVPLRC